VGEMIKAHIISGTRDTRQIAQDYERLFSDKALLEKTIYRSLQIKKQKIEQVASYTDWVQIDISDGIFTENITWNNPEDLENFDSNLNLEIHLMIVSPENYIVDWIKPNVKRIIVPVNSKNDYLKITEIAKLLKENKIELGLGLNPEITIEEIKNIIPLANTVLLLAVNPGFSGQEFQESVLEKIKKLRGLFPNAKIEVDGGINPNAAKKCIEAGSDILISSNYIFSSNNIKEAIKSLK